MFDPQFVEFALDDRGGSLFFEAEFGEAMDVASDRDRAIGDGGVDRCYR